MGTAALPKPNQRTHPNTPLASTPACHCSKNPPYGSSAAVELLRTGGDASSTSLDDYAVRVYVNHGVASPFAATSTLRDCTDPCPLPEFIRFVATNAQHCAYTASLYVAPTG